MVRDAVAARYAEALFGASKAKRALDETLEQLTRLHQLLESHPDLKEFLYNPDVEPGEKLSVLAKARSGGWSDLVQAFLKMALAMGRAESLPGIAESFRDLVVREQGRLRVVVRSAHPLSDAELSRLRKRFETGEGRVVQLDTVIDPELLGGIQVQLDHRLVDGSVRRALEELRERLTHVRV
jgi:F-type H+-transporting ATPase subunit delta